MASVFQASLNSPDEPDSSQLNVGHLRALVEASKTLNSTLIRLPGPLALKTKSFSRR